jgi:hypothetical protein
VKTLEAQVEAIARRVLTEELRARGMAPATYSSTNLPPDLQTKDRFHREARKVAGARKVGRTWEVDADAWRAYRSGAQTGDADDTASVVARMLRA